MKTGNIVHLKQNTKLHPRAALDRNSSLSVKRSRRGDGGTTTPPRRITTVGNLCAAVFTHLDESEPRIPVQPTLAAAKRNLLRELKRDKLVTTPPAYFTEILSFIYWTDAPPDAERCGLSLLMCLGSLSEAMHRFELYNLPVSQAFYIFRYFYDGADLRFTRHGGQWWMKSTPEYEEQFGAVVRVRLPHAPPENPLDLGDLLDR